MKRLLIIIFLAIAVLSCSKKENSTEETNPLVGIWLLESETENGVPPNKYTPPCYFLRTLAFDKEIVTIKRYNGNCEEKTTSFKYTLQGNTMRFVSENEEKTLTFTANGNRVVFTQEVEGEKGGKVILITTYKKLSDNPNDTSVIPTIPTIPASKLLGTWYLHSETIDGVATSDPCLTQTEVVFTEKEVTTTFYSGTNCSEKETVTNPYIFENNIINIEKSIVEVQVLTADKLVIRSESTSPKKIYITTYGRTKL